LSRLISIDPVGVGRTAFDVGKGQADHRAGADEMLSSPRRMESCYRQARAATGAARTARPVRV
jgi:hypothetical protein